MKKAIALSLLVLEIQACSSSAPSGSDVANAIKSDFQDCQNLAVENVKVINGVKVDDTTHQIHASFDLRVIPLPQKLLDEAAESTKQVEAAVKARDDLTSQFQSQEDDLHKQSSNLNLQEMGMLPRDTGMTNDEIDQQMLKIRSEIADLEAKKTSALSSILIPKLINLGDEWGSKACQAKSGVALAGSSFGGGDMTQAVTNVQVKSYDLNFTMRKTDNGWMEAESN